MGTCDPQGGAFAGVVPDQNLRVWGRGCAGGVAISGGVGGIQSRVGGSAADSVTAMASQVAMTFTLPVIEFRPSLKPII